MKTVRVQADLLCIGGGIAGLMAAIRARESGAKVVVAEKGNARYSGTGGVGCDHVLCYIPEVHGPDVEPYIKACAATQTGGMFKRIGPTSVRTLLGKSLDIVKLWEEWGIPMKHDGQWEFAGHSYPGHMLTQLKYSGQFQKKVLNEQALKSGAEIMNRTMVFELLGDSNGVIGALGIDTREDTFIEFEAKSIFLGTGRLTRLYPAVTPALMNNANSPITLTGDGRAMAYRIGAELVDVEMISRHVGLRYFVRSGQGTWIGVYRTADGSPVGKYVTKPSREYGDIIPEVDKDLFGRILESGRGPLYMDCTGISDEDYQYLLYWLVQEGNESVINYLKQEGIDLRKNPVEFMTYGLAAGAGICSNEKAETSVKGLYTAGDESAMGITAAAVFGWIGGENAARYAKGAPSPTLDSQQEKAYEKRRLLEELQLRKDGPDWKDANIALQQVMSDYAGPVRSESMLEAGLTHLRRLSKKVYKTLRARDRLELTRCIEVFNLYEMGELLFIAALERKESRGMHRRVDYPYSDPLLNDKTLILRRVDQQPITEWRQGPR